MSSTVIPGLLQFFGQDVAGHQILYTQQAHKLQVCKTHRAAAKHYHGVLGLDTEIADVGEHLTEGDDHSGVHGVQIVVQHRLSKGAVGSAAGPGGFGIAHHSVLTQRAPAGAQPRQVFRVRIHKGQQHLVAHFKAFDLGARLHDFAHALMAQHNGVDRFGEALKGAVDELDVGTAHAAGNGLNQRLILVVPGLVDLVNGNPAISLDDQRFHKKGPPLMNIVILECHYITR